MAALSDAREKGHVGGREVMLSLPEGERWFELSVARKGEHDQTQPRFIVLARDITERKAAESAMAASRNLLLTIIDAAPIRVFWKDRDLRYLKKSEYNVNDINSGRVWIHRQVPCQTSACTNGRKHHHRRA